MFDDLLETLSQLTEMQLQGIAGVSVALLFILALVLQSDRLHSYKRAIAISCFGLLVTGVGAITQLFRLGA